MTVNKLVTSSSAGQTEQTENHALTSLGQM